MCTGQTSLQLAPFLVKLHAINTHLCASISGIVHKTLEWNVGFCTAQSFFIHIIINFESEYDLRHSIIPADAKSLLERSLGLILHN